MLAIVERSAELFHESTVHAGQTAPRGLDEATAATLMRWVRSPTTTQRVVTRSLIVLLTAAGHSGATIAHQLGVTRRTVALWQRRFRDGGAAVLLVDAPGRGRKKGRDPVTVRRIESAATQPPPPGLARWTVRALARHVGVSAATVHRVWTERGLGRDVRSGAIAIPETSREEDCA